MLLLGEQKCMDAVCGHRNMASAPSMDAVSSGTRSTRWHKHTICAHVAPAALSAVLTSCPQNPHPPPAPQTALLPPAPQFLATYYRNVTGYKNKSAKAMVAAWDEGRRYPEMGCPQDTQADNMCKVGRRTQAARAAAGTWMRSMLRVQRAVL
jgi:hypothetical protein